jgi:serine/threonine-protein kinase
LQPQPDGRQRAMIVDFGVGKTSATEKSSAQDEELTEITHADMAVGTIAYMAPEQLLDSHGVTGAADIYALGAILYRAASGQQVFGSLDEIEYAKKKLVSPPTPLELPRFDRAARGLQAAVGRALAKSPADRFESAEAMLQELLVLRDLARSLAMDLDAITDMAPLSSLLGELESEALANAAAARDEATPSDATPADAPRASATITDEPPTLNIARALVDARTRSAATTAEAAPPVAPEPSPPSLVAPETLRTRSPASPQPRRLSLVLAALSGVAVGFLAHWALVEALSRP